MKENAKKGLACGLALLVIFSVWTLMIMRVDVQAVGVNGTDIGFAGINTWFHGLTGVHMGLYTITDWLGLVPIVICLCFGALGLLQLIRRRSLKKVDADILLLGGYYILVILAYLFFEKFPINYRPILIEGAMEASYPSSTTLLVLSVMPTLIFQANRRLASDSARKAVTILSAAFAAFMVVGRLVSGVHWLTDILGSVFLSAGLYLCYRSTVQEINGRNK
ncbi:MAG: phosphatase PAP2 family protein [Clostridia bacterium]|nr:phosphatase PAP2 family protein [Clostridia bacterium]